MEPNIDLNERLHDAYFHAVNALKTLAVTISWDPIVHRKLMLLVIDFRSSFYAMNNQSVSFPSVLREALDLVQPLVGTDHAWPIARVLNPENEEKVVRSVDKLGSSVVASKDEREQVAIIGPPARDAMRKLLTLSDAAYAVYAS